MCFREVPVRNSDWALKFLIFLRVVAVVFMYLFHDVISNFDLISLNEGMFDD
jgi:hypothetical protein